MLSVLSTNVENWHYSDSIGSFLTATVNWNLLLLNSLSLLNIFKWYIGVIKNTYIHIGKESSGITINPSPPCPHVPIFEFTNVYRALLIHKSMFRTHFFCAHTTNIHILAPHIYELTLLSKRLSAYLMAIIITKYVYSQPAVAAFMVVVITNSGLAQNII